jgi:hypothetical protein
MKKDIVVMLKRDLSETEKLQRSFINSSDNEEDKMIELNMKKNFYYVINNEGRIIDCAKIYSFLHEDNIYKRIIARVSKDCDERVKKAI